MPLAAYALTKVETVNATVSTGASTPRLELLINAVSEGMAEYVGVTSFGYIQFTTEAPDEYQGNGRHHLILRRFPLLSVQEVKIDGAAVTDYARKAHLDEEGILYRSGTWPAKAPPRDLLSGDPDLTPAGLGYDVKVAYKAGYILPQYDALLDATHNPDTAPRSLPYRLEEACIHEVIQRVVRPFPGLTSERTPGGHSQSWDRSSSGAALLLSLETCKALNSYKRTWCG